MVEIQNDHGGLGETGCQGGTLYAFVEHHYEQPVQNTVFYGAKYNDLSCLFGVTVGLQ